MDLYRSPIRTLGTLRGISSLRFTLEADHRRHAEIENVIRDLKYGVGLNHLPSGKFGANAAWLSFQVMAHNLALWVNSLGLQGAPVRMKTLRHRYLCLPGRLTRGRRR